MVLKVYYSSVSSSPQIKKQQQAVFMVLEGKHIEFDRIDISVDEEQKTFMWQNSRQPDTGKPLPPQLFSDTEYLGDYEAFDEAVEDDTLAEFLKGSS
ncbi:SH3 domain-binding glutamic acid-rich-like protein 2 [Saccoglossus kowalevskii]|uniref:SH3 domain-binding glutamic acid-rich-like protein n=1 Tax=Saccoglossus kowalevskii TaxID=10224 RepID=A0ABM0GXN6_SACKO|nr:PREDICTED: SH3 domain-binding glutamic acid-rich-like protein 2-like isoform X1 [Saccoglossus kowalevskii]